MDAFLGPQMQVLELQTTGPATNTRHQGTVTVSKILRDQRFQHVVAETLHFFDKLTKKNEAIRTERGRRQACAFIQRQRRLGKRSKIWKAAAHVLRSRDFSVDYDRALRTLARPVTFFDDSHWAETDGDSICLSCHKPFTVELVEKTLIHEVMHYMVWRGGRHEVSEPLEHRIMALVDRTLV